MLLMGVCQGVFEWLPVSSEGMIATIYSFVFEKGLDPKNPLNDDRGEGWAAFKIRCLLLSIVDTFASITNPSSKRFVKALEKALD